MTQFNTTVENGDISDPMAWLHWHFDDRMMLEVGYSISVDYNEDDLGITRMVITIERTE